ncbi:hypothetical protein AMTR_s00124p00124070, partial [Amborella trichopoda]
VAPTGARPARPEWAQRSSATQLKHPTLRFGPKRQRPHWRCPWPSRFSTWNEQLLPTMLPISQVTTPGKRPCHTWFLSRLGSVIFATEFHLCSARLGSVIFATEFHLCSAALFQDFVCPGTLPEQ